MTAPPITWLALLAALQGREDPEADLARLEDIVTGQPLGILADPVHDLTRWAKGLRAAAEGDSIGALHHLARFRMPVLARMSAAERIEAAARAGDTASARRWTDELATFAGATGRSWALATAAFGRALTADPATAEAFFQEALAHHADAGRPLDSARAHLAYGEWLRRAQRPVDARHPHREAVETFQAYVPSPGHRGGRHLRASGVTARSADPSTLVHLNPSDRQICASGGARARSYKDVAAQCWISPRTVAFHLRNIFTKAGITSRGELARLDLG